MLGLLWPALIGTCPRRAWCQSPYKPKSHKTYVQITPLVLEALLTISFTLTIYGVQLVSQNK